MDQKPFNTRNSGRWKSGDIKIKISPNRADLFVYKKKKEGNNLNWNKDNMPRQIIDFGNRENDEVWY